MNIEPKLTKLPGGNWRAWDKANGILVHGPTRGAALIQFDQRANGKRLTAAADIADFEKSCSIFPKEAV